MISAKMFGINSTMLPLIREPLRVNGGLLLINFY